MQVNNNVQSPNFGMALKINKGARKALENCSMETLEKLQKAGADLKDTKFYNVEIDKDLKVAITADKNAYFGLFPERKNGYAALKNGETIEAGKMVKANNIIMIEKNGTTIAGVGRYVAPGVPEPVFNTWGLWTYNTVDDVPNLSRIAKILDDVAIEKYKANPSALEAKQKETFSKTVGNLLDKFGV